MTASGVSVTGTVTASGSALTSDRRYKKNIKSLSSESSLDDVMKLRPVSYDWRTDEFPDHNFDSFTHFGFIAQEVESVIPGLVGTDEHGWKTVRYIDAIPILVKSLQMQQGELKSQGERLNSLESKFAELIKEMGDLQRERPRRLLNDEIVHLPSSSNAQSTFLIVVLLFALTLLKALELLQGKANAKPRST